jgi:hypothetical protein
MQIGMILQQTGSMTILVYLPDAPLRGGFHKSASLFAMTKMQAVVSSD